MCDLYSLISFIHSFTHPFTDDSDLSDHEKQERKKQKSHTLLTSLHHIHSPPPIHTDKEMDGEKGEKGEREEGEKGERGGESVDVQVMKVVKGQNQRKERERGREMIEKMDLTVDCSDDNDGSDVCASRYCGYSMCRYA